MYHSPTSALTVAILAFSSMALGQDKSKDKPDATVADFVGDWKSGENSLGIKEKGLSTIVLRTGSGFVAGAFKPEARGEDLFLDVTIGTQPTRWKLSFGKDKNMLIMEMVGGQANRDKITLIRQGRAKGQDQPPKNKPAPKATSQGSTKQKAATAKLQQAKKLLKEVVDKYPDSDAAEEAKRMISESSATDRKEQPESGDVKQEAWQMDYDQFSKYLAEAVKKSDPKAPFNEFNDLFAGRQVRWELKFKGSNREKDELKLLFDQVLSSLTFVSSADAATKWGKLKAGSAVVVEAKIKLASVITLNPDNQGQGTRVPIVVFEDVKPVENSKE